MPFKPVTPEGTVSDAQALPPFVVAIMNGDVPFWPPPTAQQSEALTHEMLLRPVMPDGTVSDDQVCPPSLEA
jgi:hypothetical protein